MKTEFQQIREHVLNLSDNPGKYHKSPEYILLTNWYPRAIHHCKNRMILGVFRYGYFRNWRQPKFNRVASIRERLRLFDETRNLEHLIDIMNLCGIEFEAPNTPGAYFSAGDDGHHATI